MGRPRGRLNADHDDKRAALAARIAEHLVAGIDEPPSLRELARWTDVSVPTLRHYFDDLDGALAAGFAAIAEGGRPWIARTADPGDAPLLVATRGLVRMVLAGLREGVAELHASGLAIALGSPRLGPAYLEELLEPTILAVERRLAVHRARGELADGDLRTAALQLVAPLLLAALHQRNLGGDRTRPLDLDAWADAHADTFVRGWAARG